MTKHAWYALKVRGGQETNIKRAIEDKVIQEGMENSLSSIHIPFQKMYVMRGGKREVKKCYFAYLIVAADLQYSKTKELLLDMDGVMGFMTERGWSKNKEPVPLRQKEIDKILGNETALADTKKGGEVIVKQGDEVEIMDGVFKGNTAVVKKADRKKVEVVIKIFKKDTTVELNSNQIRKK